MSRWFGVLFREGRGKGRFSVERESLEKVCFKVGMLEGWVDSSWLKGR